MVLVIRALRKLWVQLRVLQCIGLLQKPTLVVTEHTQKRYCIYQRICCNKGLTVWRVWSVVLGLVDIGLANARRGFNTPQPQIVGFLAGRNLDDVKRHRRT